MFVDSPRWNDRFYFGNEFGPRLRGKTLSYDLFTIFRDHVIAYMKKGLPSRKMLWPHAGMWYGFFV